MQPFAWCRAPGRATIAAAHPAIPAIRNTNRELHESAMRYSRFAANALLQPMPHQVSRDALNVDTNSILFVALHVADLVRECRVPTLRTKVENTPLWRSDSGGIYRVLQFATMVCAQAGLELVGRKHFQVQGLFIALRISQLSSRPRHQTGAKRRGTLPELPLFRCRRPSLDFSAGEKGSAFRGRIATSGCLQSAFTGELCVLLAFSARHCTVMNLQLQISALCRRDVGTTNHRCFRVQALQAASCMRVSAGGIRLRIASAPPTPPSGRF